MQAWLLFSVRTFLILCLCARAFAEGQPTVLVRVVGTSKFDVIYSRANTNGAGAAIGGLIGAGIQSSMESNKDLATKKTMISHIPLEVWRNAFIKTFDESLAAKNYAVVWADEKTDKKAKADIYVELYPNLHGYRVVDTSTQLVSAFVEFRTIYSRQPIKSNGKIPKETIYVTGQKQASHEDWMRAPEELGAEVESVCAQAARRLANKIIYNTAK